ncbi:MAG: formylmethanofuran dehydrogenase [Desulfobacteraceae bacterium 4572_89]|nr:MAG: formylmethanofuran dehydrogenase [Desulfobacteraceae bacterium 4572_89]
MACLIDQEIIKKTIEFHGHSCPGLAIGIRVSELAMEKINIAEVTAPVCVVETDMCAVDAVQFLTGCTYGKGNLIHKDYGKSAFTFFDRNSNVGFRALFNKNFPRSENREISLKKIMGADLEELFTVKAISKDPVRPARIMESIECQSCGELVMESRIRRFDGKYLCIPCFMANEQKI